MADGTKLRLVYANEDNAPPADADRLDPATIAIIRLLARQAAKETIQQDEAPDRGAA